jgi:hypothetical protein
MIIGGCDYLAAVRMRATGEKAEGKFVVYIQLIPIKRGIKRR